MKKLTKKQKDDARKKYIESAVITFFTSFAVVLLSQIDHLSLESLTNGAIWGVIFAAARAGVRAFLEFVLKK